VDEYVVPPGVFVNVQVPVEGRPFNTTLPVVTAQVGWVMVPTVGAYNVTGTASITTSADATDAHVAALVTAKV
jgi:hypothetical protein